MEARTYERHEPRCLGSEEETCGRPFRRGQETRAERRAQWKAGGGETNGEHWFRRAGKRGLRYLTTDVNYWKTFIHNGLNLMPEERHSISLFKAQPHQHRMLVDHLTSETRQRPKAPDGRTVDLWDLKPGAENHLFDCIVRASEIGVKCLAARP